MHQLDGQRGGDRAARQSCAALGIQSRTPGRQLARQQQHRRPQQLARMRARLRQVWIAPAEVILDLRVELVQQGRRDRGRMGRAACRGQCATQAVAEQRAVAREDAFHDGGRGGPAGRHRGSPWGCGA